MARVKQTNKSNTYDYKIIKKKFYINKIYYCKIKLNISFSFFFFGGVLFACTSGTGRNRLLRTMKCHENFSVAVFKKKI